MDEFLLLQGASLNEIYSFRDGVETLPILCILEGKPNNGMFDGLALLFYDDRIFLNLDDGGFT